MFKQMGKKTLLLSLVFGLITAGGIYLYLASLGQETMIETRQVVVMKRNATPRTVLTSEYVELREIPKEFIHQGAVTTLEGALGKIVRSPLVEGEQLLDSRLGGSQGGSDELAYRLTPGARAITLAANEVTGVAGLVQPGNYVDVIVTVHKDNYGRDLSTTIVQNRLVLAVDSHMNPRHGEQAKTVKHYTLEVSPSQAELLSFAEDKGKIRIVLRSQGDQDWADTSGAGFGDI